MKIAIAQINTTIGDFDGNADKIVDAWRRADEAGECATDKSYEQRAYIRTVACRRGR